jgi:hypothetical protein
MHMRATKAATMLAAAMCLAAGCGSTEAPAAPDVEITLERTTCLASCPGYRVTVRGDGTGEFEGMGYVDVMGKHAFAVPPEEVAALVEQARRDDLWSMRESYEAEVSDGPTYTLTLREGWATHRISDYLGATVGMPKAVTAMEDAVDRVARSRQWVFLSSAAVDRLRAEGFDFTSRDAGEMLARAVANPYGDNEAAMVRLVELGAPLLAPLHDDGDPDEPRPGPDPQALIRSALKRGHTAVADAIQARAPLPQEREARQQAIDAAFGAALRGGELETIERSWSLDPRMRPSPMVTVKSEFGRSQRIPACMQLGRAWPRTGPWDGVATVQWLEAHGCDVVRGRGMHGETFLHLAAELGDVALARWLLQRGADPNTPSEFRHPPLGYAETEDVAMALLEAGARYRRGSGADFRRMATFSKWSRVLAWVDAHPEVLR